MKDPIPQWTVYPPPETGIAPPKGAPAREVSASQKEKIEKWFFAPLREMSGHDGFVAMIVSVILYEKYLRVSKQLGDDADFSQGARAFKIMASDFDFPADDCFRFWQDWRNGLLHRAMPKTSRFGGYLMSGEFKKPLEVDGARLRINPWKFRDTVLLIVEKDRRLWKDPSNPLAVVIEATEDR